MPRRGQPRRSARRRRAARTEPGRSHQTKCPATSTTSSEAPGIGAVEPPARPGGIGLRPPTTTPTGTRMLPRAASRSGSRALRSFQRPTCAAGDNGEVGPRMTSPRRRSRLGHMRSHVFAASSGVARAVHVLHVERLGASPAVGGHRGQTSPPRTPADGTVADPTERVDGQDAEQPVRDRLGDVEGEVPAPGVADEPDLLPAQVVEHGDDVVHRLRDGEGPVVVDGGGRAAGSTRPGTPARARRRGRSGARSPGRGRR